MDRQTLNFSIANGDSLQIAVTIDDVPDAVTPTVKWRFATPDAPAVTILEASATATLAAGVWSALLTVDVTDSAATLTPASRGYVHRLHVYSGALLRGTPIVGVVSVFPAETD